MRYPLLMAAAISAGCVDHPCFIIEDGRVPYNPMSVRVRALGLPSFDGPIFPDTDQALHFIREARLPLCAAGGPDAGVDAGAPDAGKPCLPPPQVFYKSVTVRADGGLHYERVVAQ